MFIPGTVVFDGIQELGHCTICKYAPSYESLGPSSVHSSGIKVVEVRRIIQSQFDLRRCLRNLHSLQCCMVQRADDSFALEVCCRSKLDR